MRVVIQRVSEASVAVDGTESGRIGRGLLVLLGVQPEDTAEDIEWLANKIVQLRIFDDEAGAMNRSVVDAGGGILLVSQFTLLASTKKGTRPSWHRAAKPEIAVPLYEAFHRKLQELLGRPVPTGVFGADMKVGLLNDGPVTLVIDSKLRE
jgi:D-tyrosyl-tRNA(Tyr) deacylase